MNLQNIDTKVAIIGAGPGGCATALKLNQLGIPCTIIDKATFPRDKVCGDALSGKVLTILNRIDPNIVRRMEDMIQPQDIWGIRLVAPNHTEVDVPFKRNYNVGEEPTPGYVATRMDFDNFLIEEVKRCENVDLKLGIAITEYKKTDAGFTCISKDGQLQINTEMLIIANGAHSSFSKHYAGIQKEPAHYAAAVRAYMSNVGGFHEDGFIELHFLKDYIPGYFWVFPLPGGKANVGLGLRSDFVSKRKLNLTKHLEDIVRNHPALKDRFKNATFDGKIVGFPLPLGSKTYPISGDNYMLVGDAGHLVDPVTGEGIGNAIYSGWIAAEQIAKCFEQNNFTKSFMYDYDVRVERVLGAEMKLSYKLQKLLAYPRLLNFFANRLSSNNGRLIDVLSKMYLDFELRKKLVNPLFWFRMIFDKN